MKIEDLEVPLKGPKGEPITSDGEPIKLGDALYAACWVDPPKGQAFTGEIRGGANRIAHKVARAQENGKDGLELKGKDVELVLMLASIRYSTIIYGALEMLLGEGSED